MLTAPIVGAVLGFMIGGPMGLLLGAVVGLLVKAWLQQNAGPKLREMQSAYLDSMFAVMGQLCKADGVVTQNEVQAAENMFRQLRLSPEQRRSAIDAFNRGKQPGFDLDGELRHFRQKTGNHPALMRLFLQVQINAIAADGQVHQAEHEMLIRIARGLGLPASQVEQLEAMLGMGQSGSRGGPAPAQKLADAYNVLGVSESATDAEVKKAYRKLMNEHHPDKLASQGLPESMREMAEKKAAEITNAYDVIKESRH
jgi:DnaJ like chaperone protein